MKFETQTPYSEILTRRQKIARRLLPAVALSLVAGGYGASALKEKAEYDSPVAEVMVEVGPGETAIDAVREGAALIAVSGNGETFSPREADIVSEGQEVSRELNEQTGATYTQPGDKIEVTVLQNGFGNLKIEADPADKQD